MVQIITDSSTLYTQEEAKAIAAQLKSVFTEVEEIQIHNLSPVFVTQGGPKCIAIQYIEK